MSPAGRPGEQGRWRVEVDSDSCIGSGMCISIAARHFRLVDGHAQPVQDGIDPDDLVLDAGDACPVEAILVRDQRTGTVLAPSD